MRLFIKFQSCHSFSCSSVVATVSGCLRDILSVKKILQDMFHTEDEKMIESCYTLSYPVCSDCLVLKSILCLS